MNVITPPLNGITATATTTTSTVSLPPIEAGSTQYPMRVRIAASAPVVIRIYGDATSNSMLIGPGDATMVKTYGCNFVSMQALSGTARVNIQAIPDAFWLQALFNPATLFASGEQGAWYDPSDFSVLFQDSAGTMPVTAVGQPVGRMLDKSGRNNHATQPTAINRPVLQQDGNGKYFLAFNGTNSSMVTGSIDFTATDKMTMVTGAAKLTDTLDQPVLVELGPNSATTAGTFSLRMSPAGGPNLRSQLFGTSRAIYDFPWAGAARFVCSLNMDIAGAAIADELKPRLNGGIPVLTPILPGPAGTGNFSGNPLYIGAQAGTAAFSNMSLYSLIVRGALSSPAQIIGAETYVNSKTGAY